MKIYVGQVLEIKLDTKVDLSSAVTPYIRATDPTGATHNWLANVVEDTKLTYTTVKDTDLDIHGTWKLQAYPNIIGAEAPGETVRLWISKLGN